MASQQQQRGLYSSPVERCIVSLKFSKAPGTGEAAAGSGNAMVADGVVVAYLGLM
jgi:hypothetical protein